MALLWKNILITSIAGFILSILALVATFYLILFIDMPSSVAKLLMIFLPILPSVATSLLLYNRAHNQKWVNALISLLISLLPLIFILSSIYPLIFGEIHGI